MMVEPEDKEMPAGIPCLVCPETHLPLEPASAELLESLAERQRRGKLATIGGEVIDELPTGAWVRGDGALLYLVIDSISRMVIEDAINLEEEDSAAGE
jgi:uncharacterized protein YbaR (Trm112 family)